MNKEQYVVDTWYTTSTSDYVDYLFEVKGWGDCDDHTIFTVNSDPHEQNVIGINERMVND